MEWGAWHGSVLDGRFLQDSCPLNFYVSETRPDYSALDLDLELDVKGPVQAGANCKAFIPCSSTVHAYSWGQCCSDEQDFLRAIAVEFSITVEA